MNLWLLLGEISFAILILFFFIFSIYSLLEKEKRAWQRSSLILCLLILTNLIFFIIAEPLRNWLFGGLFFIVSASLIILFWPSLRKTSIEIVGPQTKIDERDVIFARFEYQPGTELFNTYYRRKPEYREVDDEIRKIPDLLTPPHIKKNPWDFWLADAEFNFLEAQLTHVDGKKNEEIFALSATENTRQIKNMVKYLGSDVCGICLVNQAYVYSHVGRGPEPYGQEIKLEHKYAIVFALEMDLVMVKYAPQAPVIVETAKKYVEAAQISIILADFIRSLGYPARAHIAGSNYQAVLPPLAWQAGLGELGRLGVIITHKYGPRARLGLVTTDLPLIPDEPRVWGIQEFCQKCQKCARNCPAQAIPKGEKTEENGVLKWVLKREECYRFWRKVGTDCAVCIYVCPYSKPANIFHNLIRKMTEQSAAAQSLSIWADDFFYGRFPRRKTVKRKE